MFGKLFKGLTSASIKKSAKPTNQSTPLYWKHGAKSTAHHTPKFISKKASIKGLKFPKF